MSPFGEWSRALRRSSALRPWELVVMRTVPSTHEFARLCLERIEEAVDGRRPGLFVAWEQTAGRGRHGRSWASPPGAGVYLTVFARGEVEDLGDIPVRIAVALASRIASWTDDRCRLKWPNDLLVDGGKIGGILIDAVHGGGAPWLFVSVGINREVPEVAGDGLRPTGLVAECAEPPSLAAMTESLAVAVLGALDPGADGPATAIETYRLMSAHAPGETLRCRLADGVVEGIFRGFDDDGHLRLETRDGLTALSAGEVVPG